MNNKFNPYLLIQTEAISSILNRTDLYIYRKICRWYSTTFHTPLHIVNSMPYDEILLHYYEHNYEKLPYNEVLRLAHEVLPELAQQKEKEDEEFIKSLLESKSKKQSLNKSTTQSPNIPAKMGEPLPESPKEIFKTFDVDEDEDLT
jgi:hypothetical protein